MRFFLIFLFFLMGCVTSPFIANDSLLQPWSADLGTNDPYKGPYAALYQKKNRKLIYVAAHHEGSIKSPTFRLVKRMFEEFSPNILVLEGFDPDMSTSAIADLAKGCIKDDFKSCGEGFYAIHLAEKTKSRFISGEPTDINILNGILEKGYEGTELILFYLLRQIPQMRREGFLQNGNFEAQANTYLSRWIKRLNLDIQITFDDFKIWYRKKMSRDFFLNEIDTEVSAPYCEGTYVQKLSCQIGIVRDSRVIQKIAQSLNENKTVMVIYGGSHLSVQRLALEAMLKKPVSYYLP